MPNPYASYADSTEVISAYLLAQLQANLSSFPDANGVIPFDVWYNDTSGLLPRTPALCVVSGPERSVYNGVGGRPVMMSFTNFIIVYYGKVQDRQQNVHGSLTIANNIKHFINADLTLGGHVIDALCSAVDPGIAIRGSALYDATRVTVTSRSKTALNP